VRTIAEAQRNTPALLYLPNLELWWDAVSSLSLSIALQVKENLLKSDYTSYNPLIKEVRWFKTPMVLILNSFFPLQFLQNFIFEHFFVSS
jgi:hypothetical protein